MLVLVPKFILVPLLFRDQDDFRDQVDKKEYCCNMLNIRILFVLFVLYDL